MGVSTDDNDWLLFILLILKFQLGFYAFNGALGIFAIAESGKTEISFTGWAETSSRGANNMDFMKKGYEEMAVINLTLAEEGLFAELAGRG